MRCEENKKLKGEYERLWSIVDNLTAQNKQYEHEFKDLAAKRRLPGGKLKLQNHALDHQWERCSGVFSSSCFQDDQRGQDWKVLVWDQERWIYFVKVRIVRSWACMQGLPGNPFICGRQPGQATCSKLTEKSQRYKSLYGNELKDSETTSRD